MAEDGHTPHVEDAKFPKGALTRISRIIANGISEFVLIREIRVKQFSVPVFEYSVFRG